MKELASKIVDIVNGTTNDYDAIEEIEEFLIQWTLNGEKDSSNDKQ